MSDNTSSDSGEERHYYKGRAPTREEPSKQQADITFFNPSRKNPQDYLDKHIREDKTLMTFHRLFGVLNLSPSPPPKHEPRDLSQLSASEKQEILEYHDRLMRGLQQSHDARERKKTFLQKLKDKII